MQGDFLAPIRDQTYKTPEINSCSLLSSEPEKREEKKKATQRSLQPQQPAGVFVTLQPDEITGQITFGRISYCLADGTRDRGSGKGREGKHGDVITQRITCSSCSGFVLALLHLRNVAKKHQKISYFPQPRT